MARGRPKLAGARRADGRLVEPQRIPANDVVIARQKAYAERFGAKVAGDTYDPIGRAWAAGLLDGTRVDPAMLRDMGRRYAEMHSRVYGATQVRIWTAERRSPAGNTKSQPIPLDPMGERFTALDQLARDAGSKQRLAMQKLVLHANPDENPVWLERLLIDASGAAIERQGRGIVVRLAAFDRDRMILTQAVQALVAMVEG